MLYNVVMGDTGPYQFSVQLLKKYTGRENDKGTNTPVFYIYIWRLEHHNKMH